MPKIAISSIQPKQKKLREKVQAQTEEFLKNGGKIQRMKDYGETAREPYWIKEMYAKQRTSYESNSERIAWEKKNKKDLPV